MKIRSPAHRLIIESFVNEYGQESDSPLVFTSESIENIPRGGVRETGKSFEVYSRARLKRVK